MTAPEPDITAMWQAHYDRSFPPRLRGAEIGNIDLVLLDSDTAGCVSSWLSNGGHLDPERTQILEACTQERRARLRTTNSHPNPPVNSRRS